MLPRIKFKDWTDGHLSRSVVAHGIVWAVTVGFGGCLHLQAELERRLDKPDPWEHIDELQAILGTEYT